MSPTITQLLTGTVLILCYQAELVRAVCNEGHYDDTNGHCRRCTYTCHKCSNDDTCRSCVSSQCHICQNTCNGDKCSEKIDCTSCIDGYYKATTSHTKAYCERCYYSGCKCTSSYECTQCLIGRCNTLNQCRTCCNSNCEKCLANSDTCEKCIVGRHGTKCEDVCPPNCKDNVCSQVTGSCSNGCTSGKYGLFCEHDCQNYCRECEMISGDCNDCNTGYFLESTTCKKCRARCSSCESLDNCITCKSYYYWGQVCEHDCSHCKTGCDRLNGCNGMCLDGYYQNFNSQTKGYECIKCPETECTACESDSLCTSCVSNHYSNWNYHTKCECRNDICSNFKHTNYLCIECTQSGWFPTTYGCCPCRTECKNGTCFSNGTCVECEQNKYGQYCDRNCSSYCSGSVCNRDGSCQSCKDGFYGTYCNYRCSSLHVGLCKTCFKSLENAVICKTCKDGYYPLQDKCYICSANCKKGLSRVCNSSSGSCTHGCQSGFFGDFCNITCSVQNCQTCISSDVNVCKTCNVGYYLRSANNCTACPNNCKFSMSCDRYNGSCVGGCIDGWSGEMCDNSCSDDCLQCEQYNESSCSLCKTGYYGDSCESICSNGCRRSSASQVCNKTNGWCIFGCEPGLWDNACESDCGAGCNGTACNRSSGHCLANCKDTHYGSLCDSPCSENCINYTGRTCDDVSGNCINGCRIGWFGETCSDECSENCKESSCYRSNGSCQLGCIADYTGPNCMQAIVYEGTSIDVAAIGGGAGAGAALLIVIALVIAVILRRRKSSSKLDTHVPENAQMQNITQSNSPPVYSNIHDARIDHQDDGINRVSNQLYTDTVVLMSEIPANQEHVYRTLSVKHNSEYDLTEEEIVDGEIIDFEDSKANGELDNTYYNLGGKRIQVAKLADYIKHTNTDDIKQEFSELPKGLLKGYKEAKKSKNAAKNKYRFIYPYDETRVQLHDGGSDYMNASYIDGQHRQREYIASSGPFKKSYDTTNDFWRMIWLEKCETLVMLTNPTENKEVKCEKYWPDVGQSCNYGNIHVTCVTEDIYADFTIRTLAVTKKEDKFNVCHLHFTAWPDKGVPHDVTSMIEFRQKMRSLHKDKTCPIIVHCSDGIGRTGTFIAIDLMTNEGKDQGSIDIFGSVFNLRYQRCNMVQTPDQYVYLHRALLHSLTFDCRSIPGDTFLQNYSKLLEKNDGQRIIDNQYQQLQSVAEEMTDDDRTEIDRNKALVKKNRSGADVPVDENRVKLKENRKPEDSDYINAVYINSFRKHQKFIVAQTPLPSTVVDFLTLIYQEKCSCVVSMEEANMKDKTVKDYWPADNQIVKHGVFQVSCKESKTEKNYMIKKLSLTYHGPKGMETHDVNLFIFTNWREGTPVPSSSDSLLDLVKTVDVMNYKTETNSPILIHCRTGAERSCLYCAVSILIEKMDFEHEVSVMNTLRQIKARRMSAISSIDQYKFCHQAVITFLQSFDTYSNFS